MTTREEENLHVFDSLSPVARFRLANTLTSHTRSAYNNPNRHRQNPNKAKWRRNEFPSYVVETETRSESCNKLTTTWSPLLLPPPPSLLHTWRQQVAPTPLAEPSHGSRSTSVAAKASLRHRHHQQTTYNSNRLIKSHCNDFKQRTILSSSDSSLHGNELLGAVPRYKHDTPRVGEHPFLERNTRLNLIISISLIGTILFFSPLEAKSVQNKDLNQNSLFKTLSEEVFTTTPISIASTTTVASRTTLSELLLKLSNAFKSQNSQDTTTTTTTTTTPAPTTTNLGPAESTEEPESSTVEEDEPSAGRDDDDVEGCASLSADESAEAKNFTDNERLVNLQSCFKGKVKRMMMKTTRSGMEMFEKLSLSGGCSSSLMKLAAGLGELKSFAFKFLDASAKIPSGFMYGLLSDFGDFDECLSIKSDPNVPIEEEANEGAFSGNYCLMSAKLDYHVKLTNSSVVPPGIIEDGIFWDKLVRNYWTTKSNKGFQFGMCFPSRCSDDDLNQLYQYVAKSYNVEGKIISCQDGSDLKKQLTQDTVQRLIIYAFYGLIGLTLIATFIDRYYPKLAGQESHQRCTNELSNHLSDSSTDSARLTLYCQDRLAFACKIITCFSIIKNWKLFTRNDQETVNNQWDCPSELSSPLTSNRNSKYIAISEESATVSTEQSSLAKDDSIESKDESNANISKNITDNEKLCQLIVKIQPVDYPELTPGKSLRHLSGLKLFVIIWITIGHSFLYPSANNYQYYRSIINMKFTRDSVWFATTNFTLGIDMLLYMIGLTFVYKLAYLNTKTYHLNSGYSMGFKVDSGGILRLISKKVLRFWPTYLTLIALAVVAPLLSEGPMWPEMVTRRLGESCRINWWSNLLFINNFLKETQICLPSSWFVSILMQLFLIGSVIVVIIRKSSIKVGILIISLLLVGSCAISFAFAYFVRVRAPMVRMDESFVMELDENIYKLYTNIFNNLGPFLVGMMGGFYLVNTEIEELNEKDNKSTGRKKCFSSFVSKLQLTNVFITVTVLSIAVTVLSTVFFQEYSLFWSSTYWSLHRVGWAIFTGYIVHNCATGRFQLLNDLLSLSTFIPLSRLIPIAYLVYPMFIHIHSGLVRDGLHVSMYNMLNIYITRLVMTFITAFFIHLLIELPLCSIEEIYLNRWVRRIRNSAEKSSKLHPLLAVAPVVPLPYSDLKTEMEQPNKEDSR